MGKFKLGREEPDEVQQGQVQGNAPGEEQPGGSHPHSIWLDLLAYLLAVLA